MPDLSSAHPNVPLRHIIEAQQFDTPFMDKLFEQANALQSQGYAGSLNGITMASLFYEPSTRTRLSFESAMHRLHGNVITTENAKEFSSFSKGETLEDTMRVLSGYVDLIVMRHHQLGAAKQAAAIASVPLINAGDGAGQHPTQALLDLYTLYQHFGQIKGLSIGMVGDLKYGRTVRSLSYLLAKYPQMTLHFIAPPVCQMHEDMLSYLDNLGVKWHTHSQLEPILPELDCVYMTRIQKERFLDLEEFEQANNTFCLTADNIQQMPEQAIIMHPLPRVNEIAPEVDADPRAAYFKQARNGIWIRMALILYTLGHWS